MTVDFPYCTVKIQLLQPPMEIFMSRVAELQARIKEAQAELDDAKLSERADALKRIKEEIKMMIYNSHQKLVLKNSV